MPATFNVCMATTAHNRYRLNGLWVRRFSVISVFGLTMLNGLGREGDSSQNHGYSIALCALEITRVLGRLLTVSLTHVP